MRDTSKKCWYDWEKVGGGTQTRTGDEGFAVLCLTTWLCRRNAGKYSKHVPMCQENVAAAAQGNLQFRKIF